MCSGDHFPSALQHMLQKGKGGGADPPSFLVHVCVCIYYLYVYIYMQSAILHFCLYLYPVIMPP